MFRIGQRVTMCNADHFNGLNGSEGIIIGEFKVRNTEDLNSGVSKYMLCYEILIFGENPLRVNATYNQIKKS